MAVHYLSQTYLTHEKQRRCTRTSMYPQTDYFNVSLAKIFNTSLLGVLQELPIQTLFLGSRVARLKEFRFQSITFFK
jgi:hypothetical protein